MVPTHAKGIMNKPIYDIDGITLYRSDNREVLPQIKGDFMFTDPPYNCGKDYDGFRDDFPEAEYKEQMQTVARWAEANCKGQMAFFVGSKRSLLFWSLVPVLTRS